RRSFPSPAPRRTRKRERRRFWKNGRRRLKASSFFITSRARLLREGALWLRRRWSVVSAESVNVDRAPSLRSGCILQSRMAKKIRIERPRASRRSTQGSLSAAGHRFGIVVSRFNAFITERLLQSAIDALRRTGAKDKDILIVRVPGSFEIPSAS